MHLQAEKMYTEVNHLTNLTRQKAGSMLPDTGAERANLTAGTVSEREARLAAMEKQLQEKQADLQQREKNLTNMRAEIESIACEMVQKAQEG